MSVVPEDEANHVPVPITPVNGQAGISPQPTPAATQSHGRDSYQGMDSNEVAQKKERNRIAAMQSRQRKKEYVGNLEKAIHVLTTEKLELQVKVATLTNQLWEQSIKIEEMEETIQKFRQEIIALGGKVDPIKPSAAAPSAAMASSSGIPTVVGTTFDKLEDKE